MDKKLTVLRGLPVKPTRPAAACSFFSLITFVMPCMHSGTVSGAGSYMGTRTEPHAEKCLTCWKLQRSPVVQGELTFPWLPEEQLLLCLQHQKDRVYAEYQKKRPAGPGRGCSAQACLSFTSFMFDNFAMTVCWRRLCFLFLLRLEERLLRHTLGERLKKNGLISNLLAVLL